AIGPNLFRHSKTGGSAWRWTQETEVQLSPLLITIESQSGYWNLGANFEEREWSWRDSRGQLVWWSPPCGHESTACPDVPTEAPLCEDGESSKDQQKPSAMIKRPSAYSFVLIPQLEVTDSLYLTDGWKRLGPGDCAALIDESTAYMISGRA